MTQIQIKLEPGALLPSYKTEGAVGMDLHAYLPTLSSIDLPPMERARIPTGVSFAIPQGLEGHVRSRSGLADKQGITLLTGTIDSDFRGILDVILINLGNETVFIRSGDRIAQIVFSPVIRAELVECVALTATSRGAGGFGSTGV